MTSSTADVAYVTIRRRQGTVFSTAMMPATKACGVPKRRHAVLPAGLCGSLVLVDEAAEDRSSLDPFLSQVHHRAAGPRRLQLQCPVGAFLRGSA